MDHSQNLANANVWGRPSIRVFSKKIYNGGLFIADIQHMPGSICGVWPAFWTVGANQANYPNDGEIDIIENINENTVNLESLHTNAGCSLVKAEQGGPLNDDGVCDNNYSNQPSQYPKQGCGVNDDSPANQPSYGTPFNNQGGGVYVMVSNCR